jgi:hypothetical protein
MLALSGIRLAMAEAITVARVALSKALNNCAAASTAVSFTDGIAEFTSSICGGSPEKPRSACLVLLNAAPDPA